MTHAHRVAVLVLLAACGKGENRAPDSVAGTAASTAQLAVGQQQRLPGELTKPLADYSGDELFALVQSLPYTGLVERSRRCRDIPGCGGVNPSRDTRVALEVVVGQDSLVLASIPRYGVIVSRGRNLGGAPEAMYGLRPGNRYTYILVALPGTGTSARWQIEQLDVVGNDRSHSLLTTGLLRGCNHPFVRGARVDFRTCQDTTVRPASTVALQGGEPPWWFSCSMGCCVSDLDEQG